MRMAIAQPGHADVAAEISGRNQHVGAPADPPRSAAGRRPRFPGLPPSRVLRRACACDDKQDADKCSDCANAKSQPELRRTADGAGRAAGSKVPPVVGRAIAMTGDPLQPSLRSDMEARLGADFGAVRVHTDATAATSAAAVNARAYTIGNAIVFGSGHFEPWSDAGRRLLMHELVHVAQEQAVCRPLRPSGPFRRGRNRRPGQRGRA